MTDLEKIERHAAERFLTPDPFVQKRMAFLQKEVEHLAHRVLCLQNENRGLRGLVELLRECGMKEAGLSPEVSVVSRQQVSADVGGE